MQGLSSLEPIAVSGATGFIGKHLVRALVSAKCRPIVLTRPDKAHEGLLEFGEELTAHEIDLGDRASIQSTLKRVRPTTIVHLAGTRGRGDARGIFEACKELNVNATVRLLEGAMSASVKRVVIAGSAEEYGNHSGPQQESLPTPATSPYGISKAMATNQALAMYAGDGCPVVVVRPFSVYGPGQPSDMFIAEAVGSAVRNVEFKMSQGKQRRDLVFVDDVVRGLIAAASAPGIEGSVINLGSGECYSLREVAELVWKLSGTKAPLLIGARSAREEELYDTWADITLARRLLQWEPRVSLKIGLRRTIDFENEQLATKTKSCQVI